MRVTQILTKTQVYEHEHPAYANAPLATYMHTYSLSLILSVCPSVSHSHTCWHQRRLAATPLPSVQAFLHILQIPMCVDIMSRVRALCEHRCVCVCVRVCACVRVCKHTRTHAHMQHPQRLHLSSTPSTPPPPRERRGVSNPSSNNLSRHSMPPPPAPPTPEPTPTSAT